MKETLKRLAFERKRFGYRRLAILARREGMKDNLKRIYRVYKEAGLKITKRKGRKRALNRQESQAAAQYVNDIWSLDFMQDVIDGGRRFRLLSVLDQYSRRCLSIKVDFSMSGVRVARELDEIVARYGKPRVIVSDNGPELTSKAILTGVSR